MFKLASSLHVSQSNLHAFLLFPIHDTIFFNLVCNILSNGNFFTYRNCQPLAPFYLIRYVLSICSLLYPQAEYETAYLKYASLLIKRRYAGGVYLWDLCCFWKTALPFVSCSITSAVRGRDPCEMSYPSTHCPLYPHSPRACNVSRYFYRH